MLTPTKAQSKAIKHDAGNLLILACAGSGKTETLASRVAHMVKNGAPRGKIVAFTFTDHAATELKHRIRRKIEEVLPEEPALGDMYVGTIHSYCFRVLRERNPDFRRFEVMDETQQAALVASHFVRFEGSGGIGLDRLRTKTRSGTYGETLRTFLNTLNVIHQQEIDVTALGDDILRDAVETYRSIAHGEPNYFLDFNTIVDKLIAFLEERSDILADLRSSIAHLFVDEYQDVDDRQERLIWLLSNGGRAPRVTVVGDDDQALYGFRGARVENMLGFKNRYPDVTIERLNENFRSTHAVVSVADEAVRVISKRIEKEPVAREPDGYGGLRERMADRGDIILQTFASENEEAEWVAERIGALRGTAFTGTDGEVRGLDYGDMAILLRSVRGSGRHFVETLRARNVPVVVSGTGGLFDNEEVQLIQASFCLLSRSEFALPGENGRLRLLSTSDTRDFVRSVISTLRETNRLGPNSNSTHVLSWIDRTRATLDEKALPRDQRLDRVSARIYPQEIFHELLQELGILTDCWPDEVMFNLGAFSNLLTQFESVHQWITPARLKTLVLFLSNWAQRHVDEGGVGELSALNSVKIMTVHAAKGLEWPVVFLPRISSRIFPSSLRNRGPDTFLPPDSYDPRIYAGGDDGERRLWYVALTRCAKFLNVSALERRGSKPTPYFSEIGHDCVSHNGEDPTHREKAAPQPPVAANLLKTTYSDLATFRRCEREYQLRSVMNFSPGVSEQFGYGQRIHDILAEIHQMAISGNVIDEGDVQDLVRRRFHLRYTRGRPFELLRNAAIAAIERYIRELGHQLTDARAAEKTFELIDHDTGALITGVVDLLERGEVDAPPSAREIVGLVDFKAVRIDDEERYLETVHEVQEQLQLYAVGVRYGLDVEASHAFGQIISPGGLADDLVKKGLTDRFQVDVNSGAQSEARVRLADTVQRVRNDLETGDFPQTGVATGNCKKCDFRKFCPGYVEFARSEPGREKRSSPRRELEEQVDRLAEVSDAWASAE